MRRRPWERSTGPRTEAGKARAKLNALKHGEYTAARINERREMNRQVREMLLGSRLMCDGQERDEWARRLDSVMKATLQRLL